MPCHLSHIASPHRLLAPPGHPGGWQQLRLSAHAALRLRQVSSPPPHTPSELPTPTHTLSWQATQTVTCSLSTLLPALVAAYPIPPIHSIPPIPLPPHHRVQGDRAGCEPHLPQPPHSPHPPPPRCWQGDRAGCEPHLPQPPHSPHPLPRAAGREIERDVNRTFPNHRLFQEERGAGQKSLFNVIKAYSVPHRTAPPTLPCPTLPPTPHCPALL
ncbi:unnamed protein product [Closterium sp. NIES-53]